MAEILAIIDLDRLSAELDPCPECIEEQEQTLWCDRISGHLGFCSATLANGRRLLWGEYPFGRFEAAALRGGQQ